ncbi:MAG: M48 family metalloprotease [Gammaproteobacteria bacterium]|nr:M48 family metalloprotease [Gammaproteobacteria bacterium]MDH4255641.1 M48 family metalloprotease [Gammaproteobacteria bacterium]MDH5310717.1 M48 family metalloprotease [Gammaproteobacteria bacterium]
MTARLIRTAMSTLCLLLAAAGTSAQVELPDIGSPADAVLSKSDEAQIGRAIMQQIRASGTLVEDPQITEYINDIGHRLAAQANDGGHKFTFFVIDEPSINAFALPGGYIGVHTGLLESTRSEDELAGVLAHEVAHVTQRHIARAIHANQRQSILSTAIMLGALVAAAAGADPNAVQGAIAVAQGSAAQAQINFTRSNEYEADRVGIAALADAGFDPEGMASFFEVISRNTSTSEMRVPEFLRTHPVSSARISEARNRARSYPRTLTDDTPNYGIARARLMVNGQETAEQAVALFESQDYQYQSDAARYGRALAYMRAGRFNEANRIFEELLLRDQQIIAYHIGLAQAQLELERIEESRDTFERAIELFPRNVPLVVHYAEALLRLGEPKKAHDTLLDLLNNVPPTPEQVRLLATAAIEYGNNPEAHYYMAEYRFMIGDLVGGVSFLQRALALPDLQEIQRIRYEARIDFIQEFMTEEQLQQMRRSRPSGPSAS